MHRFVISCCPSLSLQFPRCYGRPAVMGGGHHGKSCHHTVHYERGQANRPAGQTEELCNPGQAGHHGGHSVEQHLAGGAPSGTVVGEISVTMVAVFTRILWFSGATNESYQGSAAAGIGRSAVALTADAAQGRTPSRCRARLSTRWERSYCWTKRRVPDGKRTERILNTEPIWASPDYLGWAGISIIPRLAVTMAHRLW
jgi:hypothetical protein